MRDSVVISLDERELQLAEALQELGMNRRVARLITYLANVKEASSKDIENGTDLRQPEVSIGMQVLKDKHWVNVNEVKVSSKGRPMKIYSLNTTLDYIVNHIKEEKLREADSTMESIDRLKKLAST